jgi:hypothetical protein
MLNYAATRVRENLIHSDLLRFQIVVVFHDSIVSSEFDPEFSVARSLIQISKFRVWLIGNSLICCRQGLHNICNHTEESTDFYDSV